MTTLPANSNQKISLRITCLLQYTWFSVGKGLRPVKLIASTPDVQNSSSRLGKPSVDGLTCESTVTVGVVVLLHSLGDSTVSRVMTNMSQVGRQRLVGIVFLATSTLNILL